MKTVAPTPPIMAIDDVQDDDECLVVSTDNNEATLTEDKIGNLFQDTS